jgi:2-hydroxychromene-2-carboxylate isomerase
LAEAATTEDTKQRLRAQTDAALAGGAFGVPTMLVDGELFWGLDSFGDLEAFLRGEDALDPVALARWAAAVPSASRTR